MLVPREILPNLHRYICVITIVYLCEQGIRFMQATSAFDFCINKYLKKVFLSVSTQAYTTFRVPVIE